MLFFGPKQPPARWERYDVIEASSGGEGGLRTSRCGEAAGSERNLTLICPDLERKVFGNKGFLDIPDYEIFENFFKNCLEAKKQQLADLSPKFYLALAGGKDYEDAKTGAQDLLNAIILTRQRF